MPDQEGPAPALLWDRPGNDRMTSRAPEAAGTAGRHSSGWLTPRRVAVVDPRRHVPRTDIVLADPRLVAAREVLGAALVKQAVARAQELARSGAISPAGVADAAAAALPPAAATLTPVINATGVVVHTNLDQTPLSAAARAAVQAAAGYTDVEFDLASGQRGRRGAGALAALAAAVPAAGAAHVVNNNAAALVLAATVLADCREAVGPGTGFILKVHPSNYRIEGFTASVPVSDLAGLGAGGRRHR